MDKQLKAREIVLRRLETPIKLATAAAKKKRDAYAAKIAAAREYSSRNELQEAYGMGIISAEEYMEYSDIFDTDEETIRSEVSAEDMALELLQGFCALMAKEMHEMEYAALSDEEKRKRDTKWQRMIDKQEVCRNG